MLATSSDDINTKYSTPDWHKINDNLNKNTHRQTLCTDRYIHLEISSQFCGIDSARPFGLKAIHHQSCVLLLFLLAWKRRRRGEKMWLEIVTLKHSSCHTVSGGNGSLIKWQMTNKLHSHLIYSFIRSFTKHPFSTYTRARANDMMFIRNGIYSFD